MQPALLGHTIIEAGHYLIIYLKNLLGINWSDTKDAQSFDYVDKIWFVPIPTDDEIIHHKRFKLLASVNHSGNLNRGCYTAPIKTNCEKWLHCNDVAVIVQPYFPRQQITLNTFS